MYRSQPPKQLRELIRPSYKMIPVSALIKRSQPDKDIRMSNFYPFDPYCDFNISNKFNSTKCNQCQMYQEYQDIVEIVEETRVEMITLKSPLKIIKETNYFLCDEFTLQTLIYEYLIDLKVGGINYPTISYRCGDYGRHIYRQFDRVSNTINLDDIIDIYDELEQFNYALVDTNDIFYYSDFLMMCISPNSGLDVAGVRLSPIGTIFIPGDDTIVDHGDYIRLKVDSNNLTKHKCDRLLGIVPPGLNYQLNVVMTAIILRDYISDRDWSRLWVEKVLKSRFDGLKTIDDVIIKLNSLKLVKI